MRRADRHAISEAGIPGTVLMENAGAAVARVVAERHPAASRIVVLCGRGMNGGGGFVLQRRLPARAQALLLGRRDDVTGDARHHLQECERAAPGRVTEVAAAEAWKGALARIEAADLVVDAVLGTGLRSAPNRRAAPRHGVARRLEAGVPVVAVDLPSGVPSDTGALDWEVAGATSTVTFAAPKRGHVLPPARDAVGEPVVADS